MTIFQLVTGPLQAKAHYNEVEVTIQLIFDGKEWFEKETRNNFESLDMWVKDNYPVRSF